MAYTDIDSLKCRGGNWVTTDISVVKKACIAFINMDSEMLYNHNLVDTKTRKPFYQVSLENIRKKLCISPDKSDKVYKLLKSVDNVRESLDKSPDKMCWANCFEMYRYSLVLLSHLQFGFIPERNSNT